MVKERAKGAKVSQPVVASGDEPRVLDLMEALKRSVAGDRPRAKKSAKSSKARTRKSA